MTEQTGGNFNDWGLPIGQMVESEAFTLEHSLSLTESLEKLVLLTQKLEALRDILSDESRTEPERVKDALKTIQGQVKQTSLSNIEESNEEKLIDMVESQDVVEGQATIKIDIVSHEELNSSGEREKTAIQDYQIKQEHNGIQTEDLSHLKHLVLVQWQQLLRLKQERQQSEAHYSKQVTQLTIKLQISQEKLAKCFCHTEKGQQISKMNKWLQTLNKILYGAQKQAALSREQVKKNGQMSAKQLKQKDEYIKQLQCELLVHKKSSVSSNEFQS